MPSLSVNMWLVFLTLSYLVYFSFCQDYDPGTCGKSNHGKSKLVKDREKNDRFVICMKNRGIYSWKPVDRSQSPGEYFDPAYDCSDILDKNENAKDGFYWIKFDGSQPKKVWCDMSTDGGGYMLIGRKRSASTLSVPSNNKTVEPYGDPHWSSAFGDAPILDFRIQMATKETFGATKAHWSFRLNTKRKLKDVFAVGRGGCDSRSAGIGDIAYVTDLRSNTIVTTNFRCSKFGYGHYSSLEVGWKSMNLCLEKPCSYGFAYHDKYKKQQVHTGAFSYSTNGKVSGVEYDSTAFVGCDNGQCCGCFGPKDGTKNYCSGECKAINGGTVTRRVFTWFWLRSSIPKRSWKRCMEYKVLKSGGTFVWYKLLGGSLIPEKGRCAINKALLNEGIVVVPDEKIVKKIPAVPGLMAYRKDNKELYVRANESWNAVALEKKVTSVMAKHEQKLQKSLFQRLNGLGGISESAILQRNQRYITLLKQWLPFIFYRSKLCYRATRDGWASSNFHSRCNNKGPTVTIVKRGQYVFGGYTDRSWKGSGYIRSTQSFIFSLRNYYGIGPFTAAVYRYDNDAIYSHSGYGPTFGGGHDLYISSNAKSNSNSRTNFGYTYKSPSGYTYGSSNTKALLSGSFYFSPSEVEVFFS